jgi:hypothetical protein
MYVQGFHRRYTLNLKYLVSDPHPSDTICFLTPSGVGVVAVIVVVGDDADCVVADVGAVVVVATAVDLGGMSLLINRSVNASNDRVLIYEPM